MFLRTHPVVVVLHKSIGHIVGAGLLFYCFTIQSTILFLPVNEQNTYSLEAGKCRKFVDYAVQNIHISCLFGV